MTARTMNTVGATSTTSSGMGFRFFGVQQCGEEPASSLAMGHKRFPSFEAAVNYVLYKMRGYNAATLSFEHWQTTNPSSAPPSGHVLQDIVISTIMYKREGWL